MRTSLISLYLTVLAVMALAASPDDKPRPLDNDMVSAANRSGWPETDEMVAGRLTIRDHGIQQGAQVLSVVVEVKNRSGHALEMNFDPHDLRIELFNSDGGRVEENAAKVRSGLVGRRPLRDADRRTADRFPATALASDPGRRSY